VEINPLHIVEYTLIGTQILMAVDGKINLDDNALYRHPELSGVRATLMKRIPSSRKRVTIT